MTQYKLTIDAYEVIIQYVLFFLSGVVVMIQIDYLIEEKWVKVITILLLILMIFFGIYAFWSNPEIYIKVPEETGRQEAESR